MTLDEECGGFDTRSVLKKNIFMWLGELVFNFLLPTQISITDPFYFLYSNFYLSGLVKRIPSDRTPHKLTNFLLLLKRSFS